MRSRLRGTGQVHYLFPPAQNKQTQEDILTRLGELIILVKQGQLDNIMIASFNSEGHVLTGYSNLSVAERMTLVSYLQTDIMLKTVELNGSVK